jgi:pimeloyl-ACP methyl ester carboxylesterase
MGSNKIYYEVHGEGKPLVILNGIMMSTISWSLFLDKLDGFKIILLDFIDQGNSSRLEEEYHHDIQVECVDAVVNELGLDSVYLTGVSYGAQVALQYSIKYPNKVKRQIIFNGGAYTNPWLKDIGRAWQGAARTNDPLHFYNVSIPYVYSPEFYNKNIEWMNSRKDVLLNVFNDEFLARVDRLIYSSESYDIRNQLELITSPTLIVSGDLDYITPIAAGQLLADGIKGSEFKILEGCGHASMYEKPGDFITLLNGFFLGNENS